MSSITSNFSIIFVNGVGNDEKEADDHVRTMQDETNIEVENHYNPCSLYEVYMPAERTENCFISLSDKIRLLMEQDKKVLLIAHSFGAYITYKALQNLEAQSHYRSMIQRLITIRAFGGVCLVPKRFGMRVVNYKADKDTFVSNFTLNLVAENETWGSIYRSEKRHDYVIRYILTRTSEGIGMYWSTPSACHTFGNFYLLAAIKKIRTFENKIRKAPWCQQFEKLKKQIDELEEHKKTIRLYENRLPLLTNFKLFHYLHRRKKYLEDFCASSFSLVRFEIHKLNEQTEYLKKPLQLGRELGKLIQRIEGIPQGTSM